ncbi:glycosyltransferase [Modestobacter sp. I12A-02628]|uniref:Glycosyltransferase n=1 Tax=Goekera deserti TaxID=2497753 RepID=A0A7K3WAT8_9ACTN|nr:glycosyltransferase [Goekera deserti]MPQ97697.1 glycosyltransferase [Goekera deserti]NDI47636.1 glycosyltransferase [Goekera deserti]NDI47699.1 glycosyltransferase [Goekera deserti]NEL53447.1 glycosyltransferase [Goekera deserti]
MTRTAGSRVVPALAGLSVLAAAHAALNVRLLHRPPLPAPPTGARVTVVVPVRDEREHVLACLDAVLAQQGVPRLAVVVVDDGSSDGTADLVRGLDDPRVSLLPAGPLPPGWLGKPHACAVGRAAAGDTDVLVFLDADVRLDSQAVAAAVALLAGTGLDLVSPWPRQLTGSAAERLVQPLQQWLWGTLLPLRAAERSPRPSLAAANGQFLVCRADGYDRAGGHAPVRGAVIEDVTLLRAVKRAGGSGVVVDGSSLASCRMYQGWPAVREGYTKSLWAAVGGSPVSSAAAGVLLTAVWVVPPVAALAGHRSGLVGYAAGVLNRVVVARATGGRAWPDALAHPLSVLAFDVLLVRSLRAHRAGRLTWRGRSLDVGRPGASSPPAR